MNGVVKKIFLVITSCVIILCEAFSQNAVVIATVDSSSISIGSWMNVKIDVTLPKSALAYFPAFKDTIGVFEIVQQDSLLKNENAETIILTKKITVTSFQEGVKYFPPIVVPYKNSGDTTLRFAQSNSIPVEVRGIAVDTTQSIKDIKPPLSVPISFEEIATYFGIIVLLAAIGYIIYRIIRKRKIASGEITETVPEIPAHVLALLKLDELEEQRLWQKGEVKLFYSNATEIIREYFEKRYGILALEMTTGEVMQQLEKFKLDTARMRQIQEFLSGADLVKFAKYQPDLRENEAVIPTAKEIVETTKPLDNEKKSGNQEQEFVEQANG